MQSRDTGSRCGRTGSCDAEQAHRADRPAHDAAQHVAARPRWPGVTPSPMSISAERTWSATTRSRTSSGCDSAGRVAGVRAVDLAGQLGRAVEDGAGLVDLVEVVDALHERGHALHAHAGVDVLLRQLAEDREVGLARPGLRAALVLHEDEVPELHVAVLVDLRAALACRSRGRGRSRARCTVRTGRGCPSTRSCRPSRGARSARAAGRSPCARCRWPRRRRGRRWPRCGRRPGRSRPRRPELVDRSQASRIAPSLK